MCLDTSVYIHDLSRTSSFDNNSVLHKCSMQKQSYYKLPTQVEGYALALYHSKVVMIGGEIPSSVARSGDIRCLNKQISVLDDDCGLGELLNSTIQPVLQPQYKDVYKIGKNACAVGEGDLLIVIGGDGPHVQTFQTNNGREYVRVFNGERWSFGPIAIDSEGSTDIRLQRKTLVSFQNCIYMTACNVGHSRVKFYCISLEYFRSPLDPETKLNWSQLEEPPESQCTSLSVLGNQLVTVCRVEGWLRMYAYLPSHSAWMAVQEFQTPCLYITGIIGLPCSSPSDQVEALLVGKHREDYPTKIFKATIKGTKNGVSREMCFIFSPTTPSKCMHALKCKNP